MIITRLSRKFLKILAIIFGSILVLLTAFHFWFIHHAEGLIEDMVEARSNGKLRLDVRKFKFNWFSYDMELRDAVFYSADSVTAATSYRFSVKNMHIRVREIIPLVFEKKILIDSLRLDQPNIRVTRHRASKDVDSTDNRSVSLPQEMGRVYKSIQDALDVLKVSRFHIDQGRFTLINKIQPEALPITITNIDFHLENLQVDSSVVAGTRKILFSDNVSLETHGQDIMFPDGRHRLQFRNFRINILKKLVEFDSCTISATKDDSSSSSFTIFFDKLLLTNIDFDTLYQKEVIKADSVYCINPRFRLDVELTKKTGPRKPAPKLNDLIQQLTGDLQLAFVVVKNGSFDINTVRDGRPSSFTSTNNNFEIQGLRIHKDAPRPLTVKSFAMAIRNYENFLGDSTYAMQFDSVHIINNSIFLSNFSLKQMRAGDTINSFNMPQFELKGLSWDDLVFEQKLSAERATLYRPVIRYTVPHKSQGSRQDVFQTLAGISSIIELNHLDISEGEINVYFNENSQLQLKNAFLSVYARELANPQKFETLQQAVRVLRFQTGLLKLGEITANLRNVHFTGAKGTLAAESATISDVNRKMDIEVEGLNVNSIIIDNNAGLTEIDGLKWAKANMKLDFTQGRSGTGTNYLLHNLQGNNTTLSVRDHNYSFITQQRSISLDRFEPGAKERIRNFRTVGDNFSFNTDSMSVFIRSYDLVDGGNSILNGLKFERRDRNDSITATVPQVIFNPDLNEITRGRIVGREVKLVNPLVFVSHLTGLQFSGTRQFPSVDIGRLILEKPEIHIVLPGMRVSSIDWKSRADKNNFISVDGLKIDSISGVKAARARFGIDHFTLHALGRNFGTGNGFIQGDVMKIAILGVNGAWTWEGKIADLKVNDLAFDSLGRKNGRFQLSSGRLNDLEIRSTSFDDLRRLVRENGAFRLREITGSFRNDDFHFSWNNVDFNKYSKTFSVDSLAFRPALSKDSFIAKRPYQTDYITVKTGAISMGPFDLDVYLADTVMATGNLHVSGVNFTSHRDKRKPFEGGKIKPLPVDALRKIPFPFSTDTIYLSNSKVQYTEVNEKTLLPGIIELSQMNATILNARNYGLEDEDSLEIYATAKLMDSAKIKLNLMQSFRDSLAGFLMHASISPVDARILNDALAALASVRLQSGYLDTLTMTVVGSEHYALGEMEMQYHGLKIRFLKNGTDDKRGLFKGLANFFANAFVIKNANRKKAYIIFQERFREKSAINYIVKITLSGIGHTIGIRNNKKLLRQYKKELRKRNLPPLDYDLKTGD